MSIVKYKASSCYCEQIAKRRTTSRTSAIITAKTYLVEWIFTWNTVMYSRFRTFTR